MRYVAVFDACVLYPAQLRDLLMRLALTGLFAAKWSDEIHNEWTRNVLANNPHLTAEDLARTRSLMDEAIPDCLVTGHELLAPGLNLPDADDRHVLAAAIVAGAQCIVTFNRKDFPATALEPFGVEAVHPDDFIVHQMDLHLPSVLQAVKKHRASLKNPPLDAQAYLDMLSAQELVVTSERLKDLVELI